MDTFRSFLSDMSIIQLCVLKSNTLNNAVFRDIALLSIFDQGHNVSTGVEMSHKAPGTSRLPSCQ